MSDFFQDKQNDADQIQDFNFQLQQQNPQQLQQQQQDQITKSFQQNLQKQLESSQETQKQILQQPAPPPKISSVFIKSSNPQASSTLPNSKALSLNKFAAVPGSQKQVCYHWLKKKCTKGQSCEFLHSRIQQLIPICKYYPNCSNDKCQFRHVDNRTQCQFYAKGFCKLGPSCSNSHIQRQICPNYALGFCPKGPNCQFLHPQGIIKQEDEKIESLSVFSLMMRKGLNHPSAMMGMLGRMPNMPPLPMGSYGRQHNFKKPNDSMRRQNSSDYYQTMPIMPEPQMQFKAQDHSQIDEIMTQDVYSGGASGGDGKLYGQQMPKKLPPICFRCGDIGHRQNFCQNDKPDEQTLRMKLERPQAKQRLIHVTCKKCGEKGHYAHCCNKTKIPMIPPPIPINPQQMQNWQGSMM